MSKDSVKLEIFDLPLAKKPNYVALNDYKTLNSTLLCVMLVIVGGMTTDCALNYKHYGSIANGLQQQSDSLKLVYLMSLAFVLSTFHSIFKTVEGRLREKQLETASAAVCFGFGVGVAATQAMLFFSGKLGKDTERVLFAGMLLAMIGYSYNALRFKEHLKEITIVDRANLRKSKTWLSVYVLTFILVLVAWSALETVRETCVVPVAWQPWFNWTEIYLKCNPMFSFTLYLLVLGFNEFYKLVDLNEEYVSDMEENEKLVF